MRLPKFFSVFENLISITLYECINFHNCSDSDRYIIGHTFDVR